MKNEHLRREFLSMKKKTRNKGKIFFFFNIIIYIIYLFWFIIYKSESTTRFKIQSSDCPLLSNWLMNLSDWSVVLSSRCQGGSQADRLFYNFCSIFSMRCTIFNRLIWFDFFWCVLKPLSAIFQLYHHHGDQF